MERVQNDQPSEILVFITHQSGECAECGKAHTKGDFITLNREKGALCMDCGDLARLVFLPSGNTALTRRASKYSELRAVVLKWSRSRKRYERQGLLVDPAALDKAEDECLEDEEKRERLAERRRQREALLDKQYVAAFQEAIRHLFPGIPVKEAREIAQHACLRNSGRVGRSADAKAFEPDKIELAVRAAARHQHSKYDALLMSGMERHDARAAIREAVDAVLDKWRLGTTK